LVPCLLLRLLLLPVQAQKLGYGLNLLLPRQYFVFL
jgi:hypothetical protein